MGLLALFFSRQLKIYRVLGWGYVVCFSVFLFFMANVIIGSIPVSWRRSGDGRECNRTAAPYLDEPVIVVVLLAAGVASGPRGGAGAVSAAIIAYMKYLPMNCR